MSPICCASCAVTGRAVRRMSIAMRVRDLAGEAARGAAEREQAAPGLPHPEDRALAGDADVGALQDLGAAGDGVALDRRDRSASSSR